MVNVHLESAKGGRYRRTVLKVGDKLGLLTVVGDRRDEGRRLVTFRCDCGRVVEWPNAVVTACARSGGVPACAHCSDDLRDAKRDGRDRRREAFLRDVWERFGTLYPGTSERLEKALLDDLETRIAPVDRKMRPSGPLRASDAWEGDRSPNTQQRMADLYPIGGDDEDRCWKCVHCGEFPSRCFACVECGETACVECVRKELHAHSETDGMTLEQCGAPFGVSRERSRQVIEGALRLVRERWDAVSRHGWWVRGEQRSGRWAKRAGGKMYQVGT